VFRDLVAIPLQSNPFSGLLRHFRIRKAWDLGDRGSMSEGDLAFRYQVKERSAGPRFESPYYFWRTNRIPESDIRSRIGGSDEPRIVQFHTQTVKAIGSKSEAPGVDR